MAVSSHLGIPLDEYDERIRTFIPCYNEMLRSAAACLGAISGRSPVIVDLGTGSGALASECIDTVHQAHMIGVDSDPNMLQMARHRVGRRLKTVSGDFETVEFPTCHAMVSAFALHHVPTPARKLKLYRRIFRAIRPGGILVSADCQLASNAKLAALDRTAWLSHLNQHYSSGESRAFLRAWAKEDFYFTLTDELRLIRRAGFEPEVVWRRNSFAVIMAHR